MHNSCICPTLAFFTIWVPLLHIFSSCSICTAIQLKGAWFWFFCNFCSFAVCSFPPTQVLSELVQPAGTHSSCPSRVPPAGRAICRLLVDRAKSGSLQFFISCSGMDRISTMFLSLCSYDNWSFLEVICLLRNETVIRLHLAGWEFSI